MSKTVLASKFSEWEGLDQISLVVHQMKCIWREISKDDYGIDGEIEIVVPKSTGDGYQTTGGIIKVQSKSGSSYITFDTETSFAAKASEDDLKTWHKANFPTLFIVYHPIDEKLYWKEVRSYIKQTSDVWQRSIKINFDKQKDEFTPESLGSLKAIAEISEPRVSFQQKERLYSNLLPVLKMPQTIWSSPCDKTAKEIFTTLGYGTPPFFLHEKRLWTFVNLEHDPNTFSQLIDKGDVEPNDAESLLTNDGGRSYAALLNQVLKNHLYKSEIFFSKEYKRYFFGRRGEPKERKESWFNVRTKRSSIKSVAKYYEYGKDRFWRHDAAELHFLQLGSSWYLQISPKYFFTSDGREPWESENVGPYTTRKKAQETNYHVLNHILRWSSTLAGSRAAEHIDLYIGEKSTVNIP